MKKAIFASLFSATLLVGTFGITAHADEVGSDDPATSLEVPSDPTTAIDPNTSGTTTEPETPVDPTSPVNTADPTTPVETTDPTTPVDTTDPTTPVDTTDPTTPVETTDSTTPVETTDPTTDDSKTTTDVTLGEEADNDSDQKASTAPASPNKNNEATAPATPVAALETVAISPNGEILQNGNSNQQVTQQIETSNLKEITHVPTINTPVTTAKGESIVAVKDGVPLTQTAEGLKPITGDYKVLPSGNVEVKGNDNKFKVLPKTGEKASGFIVVLGGLVTFLSGVIFYRKRNITINE